MTTFPAIRGLPDGFVGNGPATGSVEELEQDENLGDDYRRSRLVTLDVDDNEVEQEDEYDRAGSDDDVDVDGGDDVGAGGGGGGGGDDDDNSDVDQFDERRQKPEGIKDEMAASFHGLNIFLRYYDAGFLEAALILLLLLAVVALLWVLALEYTFLSNVISGEDVPSSFTIVNLIIALVYGDLIRQSLTTYDTPPRQMHNLQHRVSQLARQFMTHHRIPRVLRVRATSEFVRERSAANGTQVVDKEVARSVVRQLVDRPFDLCKAMSVYSLQLYFEPRNDQEHEQIPPYLLREIRSWNLLQNGNVVGTLEELLDKWSRAMTDASSEDVLSQAGMQAVESEASEIRKLIQEFKLGRDIRVPDIFYGILRLVLIIYLFVMLPISIYDSIHVYMPISFALVVFMIIGPVYFRWWLGSAFERHARYVGMDFYTWRARLHLKIVRAQVTVRDSWLFAAGAITHKPSNAQLLRSTIGQLGSIEAEVHSNAATFRRRHRHGHGARKDQRAHSEYM